MTGPTDREQHLRAALRDWSDEAPHDPDLLGSVLARAGTAADPDVRRRRVVRRVVAPVLAAGLAAAAVVVTVQVIDNGSRSAVQEPPVAAPTSTPAPATPACGTATPPPDTRPAVPAGSEDPGDAADWERGLSRRWGLKDIAVPSGAITDTAATFPDADGGQTYDDATLTFTQWVVAGADDGPAMRAAVQAAFDDAAAGSNIGLDFGVSPLSQVDGVRLMDELGDAYRTDPEWPAGVDFSGALKPDLGQFEIGAGDAWDDPSVRDYFESRWPCQVRLDPVEYVDQVGPAR